MSTPLTPVQHRPSPVGAPGAPMKRPHGDERTYEATRRKLDFGEPLASTRAWIRPGPNARLERNPNYAAVDPVQEASQATLKPRGWFAAIMAVLAFVFA